MREDRSIGRSRRRTTTGSTGKALLAQQLGEPGIEHAAQVGLVQIASQDALGDLDASLRRATVGSMAERGWQDEILEIRKRTSQ